MPGTHSDEREEIPVSTPGNVTVPVSSTPQQFWPPLAAPNANDLFSVIDWVQTEADDEVARFLLEGVQVRPLSYGEGDSSGIWDGAWNVDGSAKTNVRPTPADPYLPVTVYAMDSCSLSEFDVYEVERNSRRWLEITKETNVGKHVAARLLSDAGVLPAAVDYLQALGSIEAALRLTGLPGSSTRRQCGSRRMPWLGWSCLALTGGFSHPWETVGASRPATTTPRRAWAPSWSQPRPFSAGATHRRCSPQSETRAPTATPSTRSANSRSSSAGSRPCRLNRSNWVKSSLTAASWSARLRPEKSTACLALAFMVR